jgi:hypothetical protein
LHSLAHTHGILAACGLTYQFEVAYDPQEGSESTAYDLVVIHNHDPNGPDLMFVIMLGSHVGAQFTAPEPG